MPSESPEIRIALDEKDFEGLVNGKVISVEGIDVRGLSIDVKMILKDIGWDRMILILRDAVEGNAVDGSGNAKAEAEDAVGTPEGGSVASEAEGESREAEDPA
jgi:hypothetical protein